jgi:HPt (histidine-containing phosphotransfer) domain-containing protein
MDDAGGNPLQENAVATLWEIAGGSIDLFRELIDEYVSTARQLVADIERGLAANDVEETERAAHSLKGSSSMMGAHLVQKASQAIEQAASSGDLAAARSLLPALCRVNEATLVRLLEVRDEKRTGA